MAKKSSFRVKKQFCLRLNFYNIPVPFFAVEECMQAPIDVTLQRPETLFDFAGETQHLEGNALYLIGFGFDGTACFRKGTKLGPDALRDVSDGIESYSPYLDADTEGRRFFDLGNLQLADSDDATEQWQGATDDFFSLFGGVDLEPNRVRVLTIGGEHSISYAPIKTYLEQYPDLVLVHLDAHADLRDGYEGYHYSHASIIRRVVEHFGPDHQLIQYGIRSGTREEYQWMREHGTVRRSRQDFLDAIRAIPQDRPVYLTLDLDYFDPSFFPGTGTPEPGGEDFHSFVALTKLLMQKHLVGADVVELSPPIDSTGNSSVFAAKVVRELILCLTRDLER